MIAGLGGLGSIIAENLIHMGFQSLILVDPDVVEISNLSRLVGATFADVARGTRKVAAVKRQLLRLNTSLTIR